MSAKQLWPFGEPVVPFYYPTTYDAEGLARRVVDLLKQDRIQEEFDT